MSEWYKKFSSPTYTVDVKNCTHNVCAHTSRLDREREERQRRERIEREKRERNRTEKEKSDEFAGRVNMGGGTWNPGWGNRIESSGYVIIYPVNGVTVNGKYPFF